MITERQKQVLELVCQDFTNKEIAEKLLISEKTVDYHRKQMLERSGRKSFVGVVIWAFKYNLLRDNFNEEVIGLA